MLKFIKIINRTLCGVLTEKNFRLTTHVQNYRNLRNFSYSTQKYSNINTEEKYETNNIVKNEIIDKEKRLKILELEMDVARQEGRKVPDPKLMKDSHWEHLLSLGSRTARTKYYTYLWKLEKKKENEEMKKIKAQEKLKIRKEKEKLEASENDHILYGLNHTGFLLRIYDATINHWYNNRLIQAMRYGQKLIFDCSFDDHMTKREAINTAKQLMFCFSENRVHDEPFDLHFCNANLNGVTMEYLQKHIPTLLEPSFPLNVHQKCFTELFPKEKLVYLTPHCRNDLMKFNPDDLYIIGSIVDKVNNEPLSLAKAKKLGIRMARLPLDRYLQWGSGSGKSLTLNQMTNILLDIKKYHDWQYALRHVPKRKISNEEHLEKNTFKLRKKIKQFDFNVKKWAR